MLADRLPLRWRLTLWYVVILALALALFGGVFYLSLARHLYDALDSRLRSQMAVAQTAVAFEGGQLRLERDRLQFLRGDEWLVRLVTAPGQVVASYQEDRQDGPDARELSAGAAAAVRGQPDLRWVSVDEDDDEALRVLSQPVVVAGQVVGVLQVGIAGEEVAETLATTLTLLAVVGPLVLLLASLGGVWLASRALAPVDRITRMAAALEAQDLSRRIDLALPNDELGRLVQTFNAMLARLEAAFQRQRRFTADAAHELRTPLALMQSQIELALQQPRHASEDRAVLELLAGDLERLTRLTNALLMLARHEEGQVQLSRDEVALETLLEVMGAQYAPLAAEAGVELRVDAQPVRVLADEDRLIQVLVNLLDNALRHTPAGKRVILGCRPDGRWARLWVADEGTGIAAEHLPHLFDRFYRAEAGRDRARGGIGLGLSISKMLVELHGGTIEVASSPGQGTIVTVLLPLEQVGDR